MANQQVEIFPMARKSDPDSSHKAAKQHAETNLSERRAQTLALVKQNPGRTQGELARLFLRAWPALSIMVAAATPHKRLPELERLGLVERGATRKCADSGHESATWKPTQQENER